MATTNAQTKAGTSIKKWALLLGFFAILGGTSWITGQYSARLFTPNKGLVADSQALDFGSAYETSIFTWKLPITNQGREPVQVARFLTSCRCLKVVPESVTIAAGETINLELQFDLRLAEKQRQSDFHTSIIPQIEGSYPQQSGWRVTGKVLKALDVNRTNIELGELYPDSTSREGSVEIRPLVPLADFHATSANNKIDISVQKLPNIEGYKVYVRPQENLPIGHLSDTLQLHYVLKGHDETFQKAISVNGSIYGDVNAFPRVIVFGSGNKGEQMETDVTIASRSQSPFEILKIKTEPGTTVKKLQPTRANGEASFQFQVIQQFDTPGNQQSKLTVHIQNTSNPSTRESIEIPIQYYVLSQN